MGVMFFGVGFSLQPAATAGRRGWPLQSNVTKLHVNQLIKTHFVVRIVIGRISQSSNTAKFGTCQTFGGKHGKDLANVSACPQTAMLATSADGRYLTNVTEGNQRRRTTGFQHCYYASQSGGRQSAILRPVGSLSVFLVKS